MKKNWLLFIVLLGINNSVFSQRDSALVDIFDLTIEQLMELEVYSTSRTSGQSASEAPATVMVITQEQISERAYQSLLDVFYDLPDIKVDYAVAPRWMNDITIRGIRGMDKFIILLDGVRISSPTNDVVAIMENYPVHYAKQIEIIYGPASALYGADAFSGVINIISKKSNKKNELEMLTSYGMYNTINSNLYFSQAFSEKKRISIAGQYFYDEQPNLAETYKADYEGMMDELETSTFNTMFGPITPQVPVEPVKSNPMYAYNLFVNMQMNDLYFSYFGNHYQIPSTTASSPHNAVYNKDSKFGSYINTGSLSYKKAFNKLYNNTTFTISRYDLDSKSNFRNVWTNMEPAYLYAFGSMLKLEELVSYKIKPNVVVSFGVTYESFKSMPRSNNLQAPISESNSSGRDISFNLFGNEYSIFLSEDNQPKALS